ncbi:MAG: hypothetical protein RLZZ74_940 [Cyanobacteriota bacterium]
MFKSKLRQAIALDHTCNIRICHGTNIRLAPLHLRLGLRLHLACQSARFSIARSPAQVVSHNSSAWINQLQQCLL